MCRHHPQTARLAELVADGRHRRAAGDPHHVRLRLFDVENVRLRTDLDGGALMDVGCYCVSGARLLGGEPERVSGRARASAATGVDGRSPARCASRATCSRSSTAATCLPSRDELEAIGSEGSLFLDDPWHCREPVIELRRGTASSGSRSRRPNPYRLELEDLGARSATRHEPLLGRDDAVAQARVIDALRRSAPMAGTRRRSRTRVEDREVVGQALMALARVVGDRVHERLGVPCGQGGDDRGVLLADQLRSGMPRPRVRRAMRAS